MMKSFVLDTYDECGTVLIGKGKEGIKYCPKCHPACVDFVFFRLNKC